VDLLVLPSLTEGMPMVLLEAQYFGLPIVASKVGGIPEIVTHERNGFLVQPGDSAGLAKSIIRLLQDEDLALQIKNANQKKFTEENYIDSCISRYEDIYMDMMRGKGLEK
jgi:glycosyltransferase involved in cell wall biosynthesis